MYFWRALAILLAVAPSSVQADNKTVGATGASFLKVSPGPRASGMGESFVGLADDVNTIYYNPAGLATLKRQELTLMHNELFADVRQEWLAYAYPTETLGSFALSVDVQHIQPFDSFDANNSPGTKISAQDAAYELAYALRLTDSLTVGGAGKLIKSRLDNVYAVGAAFDAGVLYETRVDGLKLGASALNMGPPMRFISEYFNLPLAGKAGFSYKFSQLQDRGHEFTLVSDVTVYRDRNAFAGVGIEYLRQGSLALRAGWTGFQTAGYGMTLGAGVDINRLTKGRLPEISFDYGYEGLGDVGQSHRASMTFRFGGRLAPSERRLRETEEAPRRAREPEELKAKPQPKARARSRYEAPEEKPAKPLDDGSERIWVNP